MGNVSEQLTNETEKQIALDEKQKRNQLFTKKRKEKRTTKLKKYLNFYLLV